MVKIGVAIVTYNRINKLKTALLAYSAQTIAPSFIVVFNNNSTDGTGDFLELWKKKDEGFQKIVIESEENVGGSGGFYGAMLESTKYDFDLLWLSDDDAYPESNSLELVANYYSGTKGNIGAICGTVVENGKINCEHRSVYPKISIRYPFGRPSALEDYEKNEFRLQVFSYVGVAISKAALERCGLTKKDYFIWCDDAEHSMRIAKQFEIVCLPQIKIVHDVDKANSSGLSWKSYYGIRNRFDAIRSNGTKLQLYYYHLRYLCKMVIAAFTNKKKYKLIKTAIHDYKHGIFGISKIYKPGAKL